MHGCCRSRKLVFGEARLQLVEELPCLLVVPGFFVGDVSILHGLRGEDAVLDAQQDDAMENLRGFGVVLPEHRDVPQQHPALGVEAALGLQREDAIG